MFYAYLFSIWLLTLNTARGHTWVEQLSVVDDNGNLIGDSGFIRGFGEIQCRQLFLKFKN